MADDIMLRSTSLFEQLKLEDKTEYEIFQEAIVVTERKDRLTEEVMNSKDPNEQSQDRMVNDIKTIRKLIMAIKRKKSLAKITSCEDLIAEIFARLPLKSVIRLRCLSKSWYSRIASPDFIRMYTLVRTMNTPEKVLIQHETCNKNKGNLIEIIYTLHSKDRLPLRPRCGYMDVTPVQFPVHFPFWSLNIIGSCNGIVCFYQEAIGFVLWNFSVRRQVQIPYPPFRRAVKEGYVKSLGFGFDSITHDYKIVGISEGKNANTLFIYSLKTNSWSEIDFPDSTRRFFGNQRACFLDGALHWVETRSLDETQNLHEHIILTFSLNSHVFGTIPLPEPCRKAREVYRGCISRELSIVDGCLALTSSDTCTLSYIRVWVMKEYGDVSSWSMVHEFDWSKQFNGVEIEKLLTNGGLLLDKRGTNTCLDDGDDDDDDRAWYEVYYPNKCLEVLKYKKTSDKLEMEMYVESLELLDKGTPCGETIFLKKKKQETISSGRKRGKKGRFGSRLWSSF